LEVHHRRQLALAKIQMLNPSLASKMSNYLGKPIEGFINKLPVSVRGKIDVVTRAALEHALTAALFTLSEGKGEAKPSNRLHKATAALSGAVGGAWGLPALSIELPISTTIILRSIADIARSEGEDLRLPETKLACLEVLALGGSSPTDDAAESGYFAMRAALAQAVSEAASFVSTHGAAQSGAPALVRLISQIAARFSIPVSQKVAAQSIPVIGAFGGAAINTLFMDHFQSVAQGHFVIQRLERTYGDNVVQSEYLKLPSI
jgi:hypothetical protein